MVTFVATALFADRCANAAPALKPEVIQVARRLAGRLVINLRRTIPAMRLHSLRTETRAPLEFLAQITTADPVIHSSYSSPHRFRLPPPTL